MDIGKNGSETILYPDGLWFWKLLWGKMFRSHPVYRGHFGLYAQHMSAVKARSKMPGALRKG